LTETARITWKGCFPRRKETYPVYIWGKRKGGVHVRSSVLPGQQKSPPSAAAATRKGSRGRKPVRRPRAENGRESARIWGKGRFPRPKQCPAAAAEINPFCCRGSESGSRGRKPVRRPRAENARESPRIRGKGGFHTREPVYCRGSRNRSLLLPRQREKNCGALQVQCTAGVPEGAMSLRYIGG
jgi:hypothetical protein